MALGRMLSHLSKWNVSTRPLHPLPRWEPHPGSRDRAHWYWGWKEAAHQFKDGSWRDAGLEVLPPGGIPYRQNKQGGVCVCGQIWASKRGACGRSELPFILGGMEDWNLREKE